MAIRSIPRPGPFNVNSITMTHIPIKNFFKHRNLNKNFFRSFSIQQKPNDKPKHL